MPPLPSAQCQASTELQQYLVQLSQAIPAAAGRRRLLAAFDLESGVRSLCMEADGSAQSTTEQELRIPPLDDLPPGPACVASCRLPLSRAAAKEAEIKRVVQGCVRNARRFSDSVSRSREFNAGYVQNLFYLRVKSCIADHQDWLFLEGPDQTGSLLFVRPGQDHSTVSDRRRAVRSCASEADMASLVACMDGLGWENLE
jgi:hypothetical protein